MDRYPYFLYPAICELKRNPDPERARQLKEFIAVNVSDRDTLLVLTGSIDESLRDFYPAKEDTLISTDTAIDSFISKFSSDKESLTPVALMKTPHDTHTDEEDAGRKEEASVEEHENPEEAMEKVKILVKNRDYDGALAIMEEINLNNPKKSVYFADQIRFLRKLKLNESKKQQ